MSVKSLTVAITWVAGGANNSLLSDPSPGWAWFGRCSSVMMRDHIKSRASLKGEVWPGRRESVEYGGKESPWPSSHDADSEGSEPVSGEESGLMAVASDTSSSGSPVRGLMAQIVRQVQESRLRTWRCAPDLRPERRLWSRTLGRLSLLGYQRHSLDFQN